MNELLDKVLPINPLDDISIVNLSIPGAILVVKSDAEFTVEKANQGLFDLMGYSPEELAEQFENKGMRAIHPDDLQYALSEFLLQIHNGANQNFSIKARLAHKQDGYRWVHFGGCIAGGEEEQERIHVLLTDISDQQETMGKLKKEMLFNQMVENLCEDAFFDCDILSGHIRFSKNFAKRFCIEEVLRNYPEGLLERGIVAQDSMAFFACGCFCEGENAEEEELHMILPSGEEVWYSCHYKSFFDSIGIPLRTVGKLTEITKQKSRIEELAEKAARDPLTGLFNKTTTEVLIRTSLKEGKLCHTKNALLIVDVDNFKDINDRLGHLYGDMVLTQLAEGLKQLCTPEDVVGRIGGDEFFIFLHNYESIELLKSKAEEIRILFHKVFCEKMETVYISASIGIALCPEHGEDFYTLYQNADIALYISKQQGKDACTIYDGQVAIPYQGSRTKIEFRSAHPSAKKNYPLDYIYKRIYSAKDVDHDFREVLRLLAEHYEFSRAYLMGVQEGSKEQTAVFEWCAKGVSSAANRLEVLPKRLEETMLQSLCDTGLFVLGLQENDLPNEERDVIASYGIKSMLQFAIKCKGELIGIIGFEDEEKERIPSETALEELGAICFVIGNFLSNWKVLEREKKERIQITALLDDLPAEVYVVDEYRVLYENNEARKGILGNEGRLCYERYWGRKEPCLHCPYHGLEQKERTSGVSHVECGEQRKSVAKWVSWGEGHLACLITRMNPLE